MSRNPFIKPLRESTLEKRVGAWCKERGVIYWKFSSPGRAGVPDRILIKNGKVIFLELKVGRNKPSALQLRHLGILNDEGVAAIWSNDFEEICEWIKNKLLT